MKAVVDAGSVSVVDVDSVSVVEAPVGAVSEVNASELVERCVDCESFVLGVPGSVVKGAEF